MFEFISESENKKYAGAILIIGLLMVLLSSSQILQGFDTQEMAFAESNTTVVFGLTGYKDGVPVTEPIYQSGFLFGGVEVDSVELSVVMTATGTDVDWTTFSMEVKTSVANLEFPEAAGLGLHTFNFVWADMTESNSGGYTESNSGGYTASASHMVDELDYVIPGDPVEILEDGTKIYNLYIWADVAGSVIDYNSNVITASARATVIFVFTSYPDGTLDLDITG